MQKLQQAKRFAGLPHALGPPQHCKAQFAVRRDGSSHLPITFDLNPCILETSYPSPSWQNAYADVGRFLRENGFSRQQGSVYFGDETIDVIAAR